MMDAVHIELLEEMLDELETNTSDGLCADSEEFSKAVLRAGFQPPIADAGSTDSRFRMFLTVEGKPELTGVYYVSGWRDSGIVHLSCDPDQVHIVPKRREAVLATRRKLRRR